MNRPRVRWWSSLGACGTPKIKLRGDPLVPSPTERSHGAVGEEKSGSVASKMDGALLNGMLDQGGGEKMDPDGEEDTEVKLMPKSSIVCKSSEFI